MSQVAERYSEAFFKLAESENKIDLWQSQMDQVDEALGEIDNLNRFFNAVKISTQEKKRVLEEAFGSFLDPTCLNFLKLLVDKKRINEVHGILKEFHSLCNEHKGIEEGLVESAFPLPKEQLQRLEEAYKQKGKKVELKNRVNPSLISGFRIVLQGEEIDRSMRYRLDQLKKELNGERRAKS